MGHRSRECSEADDQGSTELDGEVGNLVGEGLPAVVGLGPDELFASAVEDKVEPFDPGDTLVLYTDGVTEAPNEEEKEFSSARLADVVRALHTRSAREINDGVLERVHRFAGTVGQRADLTLVTVKRS